MGGGESGDRQVEWGGREWGQAEGVSWEGERVGIDKRWDGERVGIDRRRSGVGGGVGRDRSGVGEGESGDRQEWGGRGREWG